MMTCPPCAARQAAIALAKRTGPVGIDGVDVEVGAGGNVGVGVDVDVAVGVCEDVGGGVGVA